MGISGPENKIPISSPDPTSFEKAYLKAYLEISFPDKMNAEERKDAINASQGRKIIFLANGKYFFEENEVQDSEVIKDLKRFLGCGG